MVQWYNMVRKSKAGFLGGRDQVDNHGNKKAGRG